MKQMTLFAPAPADAAAPAAPGRILMVGHSNHDWEKFAALLTRHGVKLLLDVRNNPQSRYCPHFNARRMAAALAELGIEYRHVPALGGKTPLPLAELRAHVGALLPLTAETCCMCSEGKFIECHRHYFLAPLFIERGWRVEQILPSGELVADPGPNAATLRKNAAGLPPGWLL